MSAPALEGPSQGRDPARLRAAVGVAAFLLLAAAGIAWAKWLPYGARIGHLFAAATPSWTHRSVFDHAAAAGAAPGLHAGARFLAVYGLSIWQALVVGLVVAAALEALVPRDWLLRVLRREARLGGSVAGGLLALPAMMCTCCSAPIVRSLRRRGAPASGTLSFWLGNPLLNPAVIVFLALVGPWQWVAVRLLVGGLLVFAGAPLLARLLGREPPGAPGPAGMLAGPAAAPPATVGRRFARALLRLSAGLVPEYALVVFCVGALRGWLFPFGPGVHLGALAVLVAAVVGTLVVIPTAGEIPVLLALAAGGAGAGVLGALLVALPAVSLPSMAMVGRGLGWKLTAGAAGAVAAAALLGAGLLSVIS